MRIGCPGCDAAYEVPDAQIRPGRSVQCVRCEARWQPAGPAPAPIPAPAPAPASASAPAQQGPQHPESILRHHSSAPIAAVAAPVRASRPASHATMSWGIAWGASVCLLGTAGFAFAHFRGVIIHGWPATIRVYELFGAS